MTPTEPIGRPWAASSRRARRRPSGRSSTIRILQHHAVGAAGQRRGEIGERPPRVERVDPHVDRLRAALARRASEGRRRAPRPCGRGRPNPRGRGSARRPESAAPFRICEGCRRGRTTGSACAEASGFARPAARFAGPGFGRTMDHGLERGNPRNSRRRSALDALEALGLRPERLHLVEARAFGPSSLLGEALFDMGEAALELGVGPAQRRLGIDRDAARD